ncbi:MAG: hypothetical protein ACLTU3_05735 [Acutalibacteraceae bacterium]
MTKYYRVMEMPEDGWSVKAYQPMYDDDPDTGIYEVDVPIDVGTYILEHDETQPSYSVMCFGKSPEPQHYWEATLDRKSLGELIRQGKILEVPELLLTKESELYIIMSELEEKMQQAQFVCEYDPKQDFDADAPEFPTILCQLKAAKIEATAQIKNIELYLAELREERQKEVFDVLETLRNRERRPEHVYGERSIRSQLNEKKGRTQQVNETKVKKRGISRSM